MNVQNIIEVGNLLLSRYIFQPVKLNLFLIMVICTVESRRGTLDLFTSRGENNSEEPVARDAPKIEFSSRLYRVATEINHISK